MALEARKYRWVACIALVIGAVVLVTGCGGGSGSATAADVPTAAAIKQCIVEAGGGDAPLAPREPPSSPQPSEKMFAVAPEGRNIAVFLFDRPVYTPRLVKQYDELGEYYATTVSPRVLILLDPYISRKGVELAFRCVEG